MTLKWVFLILETGNFKKTILSLSLTVFLSLSTPLALTLPRLVRLWPQRHARLVENVLADFRIVGEERQHLVADADGLDVALGLEICANANGQWRRDRVESMRKQGVTQEIRAQPDPNKK